MNLYKLICKIRNRQQELYQFIFKLIMCNRAVQMKNDWIFTLLKKFQRLRLRVWFFIDCDEEIPYHHRVVIRVLVHILHCVFKTESYLNHACKFPDAVFSISFARFSCWKITCENLKSILHWEKYYITKKNYFFLFLEYLIRTILKTMTSTNIIILQYRAIGAKSKQ